MAIIKLVNPKRRRRRRSSPRARAHRTIHRNPRRRHSRRRVHSNPKPRRSFRRSKRSGFLSGGGGLVKGTLMPAATGAAGALAVDMALGFLPLPANLMTGMLRPVVRLGAAYGIGKLGGMVTNKRTGHLMMAGAVTVIAYDIIKSAVQTVMPNLALSEYVGMNGLGYMGAGQMIGSFDQTRRRTVMPVGEYVGM